MMPQLSNGLPAVALIMNKDEVLAILSASRIDYTRFGVKSLALFGSVARDEAQLGSDVDILVEFDGTPTFERYMDFKFLLEDTLGRPVDLVERQMLHPSLQSIVENEAIPVA